MAAVLVLARLCEPSSELHIAEDWYRRTALDDLLALPAPRSTTTGCYRALDRLLPHKTALEQHLKQRLGELFALDYDLLLYDVTSTYFEGEAAGNPLAQRGHSRDHRPDCKQVCIALVVTREGMPLGYEVFAGNRTDVTTVEEIVGTMEARYGQAQRIWVMDRGMTSAENLAWLRQTDAALPDRHPEERAAQVGGASSPTRGLADRARGRRGQALCRARRAPRPSSWSARPSGGRRSGRCTQRFAERIEAGLATLARRLAHAPPAAWRAGRSSARSAGCSGATRAPPAATSSRSSPTPASPRACGWPGRARSEWDDWARHSEGCYVLRTNITDWSPEELWRTYIQLTEAEAAFRIHKSELSIRPIWHQREDRVQAHILVCFLAYVLWKTLEQWQSRAGLGNSPRTILDELGRIQSTDVVLPTDRRPRAAPALRRASRPGPGRPPRSPRPATCPNGCASARLPSQPAKCSADFFAKSLKSRPCPPRTAEVGLGSGASGAVLSD